MTSVFNWYGHVHEALGDRSILLHFGFWLTKPLSETEAVSFSAAREFPRPRVKGQAIHKLREYVCIIIHRCSLSS